MLCRGDELGDTGPVEDVGTTARRPLRSRVVTRVRGMVRSQGAGESGLSAVTDLTFVNTAGDALIAVALAGTLFFSVPTDQARGNVALYLLVTMTPFVLLAPLVGPLLDRFPHARRYALALSALGRAVLAWYLIGAIDAIGLYPTALLTLVLSRAFHISRAATVPRVLPPDVTLVAGNARLSLAAFAGGTSAVALGALLSWLISPTPVLWAAVLVFCATAVMSLRLPRVVDGSKDEIHVRLLSDYRPASSRHARHMPRSVAARTAFGPHVISALRSAAALRVLAGFLTLFLVFLIRVEATGLTASMLLALLAAAAGGGSVLGASAGLRLPLTRPEVTAAWLLVGATAACILGALSFSLTTGLVVAFISGVTASLGKLCADALIQREVDEDVRVSAFARSETMLQLAWVVGGFLGILLPLSGTIGFGVLSVLLVLALAAALVSLRRSRRSRRSRDPWKDARVGGTGGRRPSTRAPSTAERLPHQQEAPQQEAPQHEAPQPEPQHQQPLNPQARPPYPPASTAPDPSAAPPVSPPPPATPPLGPPPSLPRPLPTDGPAMGDQIPGEGDLSDEILGPRGNENR